MSFNVIDQYNSFVENNFIKSNNLQIEVLKKINNAWNTNKKISHFKYGKAIIRMNNRNI